MTELLLCPFCGGEAVLHPTYDMDTGGVDGWFAWCDNDTCECKPETGQFLTEAEAIEAWNSRAERTCKLHDCEGSFSAVNKPVWRCDCGAFMTQYTDATTYHKPRFCPNCGAFFKEYDELRGDAE